MEEHGTLPSTPESRNPTPETRNAPTPTPEPLRWQALGFNLDEAQQNRTFMRKEKTERGDTSAWTDTPADKARRAVRPGLG